MSEGQPFKIYRKPELQSASLIVAWSQDAGRLGLKVADFLKRKLAFQEFGEIETLAFFFMGGVLIEDNVVQFPKSRFYSHAKKGLLLFESDGPTQEHYRFLTTVLDAAESCCKVKELYTLGGIVSVMAHTSPRRISTVVNQPELKKILTEYGLDTELDYQTPPGGRPTLSSFLLWVAKRRNIVGANLWGQVPFYLTAAEDPRACKRMLEFLDNRFDLGMDWVELNMEIEKQNGEIKELKERDADINRYVEMLERGIMLTEDENKKLAKEMTEFLERRA